MSAVKRTAAYGMYPRNVALPEVVSALNQAGFGNEDICMVLSPAHPVATVVGDAKIGGGARAAGDAYPDPKDKSGKLATVDVVPVKKLPRPVTLAQIKAKAFFEDFPLVRISRLSVMPVTDAQWSQIEKMAAR